MAITDRVERVINEKIWIDREKRQRREFDVEDILPSIKLYGVIQPIIVDHTYKLIAGERRLTANIAAGRPDILVRFVEDLSPIELRILELEENIRRKDLTWQETATAVGELHYDLVKINENWTIEKTGDYLGYARSWTLRHVRTYDEILKGNQKVIAATTVHAAYNMIARESDRKTTQAIADFLSIVNEPKAEAQVQAGGPAGRPTGTPLPATVGVHEPVPLPILTADFHEWAADYRGPKFNLLHFDFPYGIDMQDSEQGKSEQWGGYEDQEKIFWDLMETFALFHERFASTTAHVVFWFHMNYYGKIFEFFEKNLPSFNMQPMPLFWMKTDNRGIVPDPQRQPRRIVETALLGSRGDRKIVKVVSNGYGAPTHKSIHQSEKPRPMLQHFFSMLVDGTTRLLDPTCGSGNSLIAASSLGAEQVLGLEINEDFAADARNEYKKFLTLRSLTEKKDAS